jgi:hypothetical protein
MSTKIEHILKTQEEYVCSKKQILVNFGDSKKFRDFTLILRLTWELLCLVERLAFHSGVQRVKLYPVHSCSFPTFQSAKNSKSVNIMIMSHYGDLGGNKEDHNLHKTSSQ